MFFFLNASTRFATHGAYGYGVGEQPKDSVARSQISCFDPQRFIAKLKKLGYTLVNMGVRTNHHSTPDDQPQSGHFSLPCERSSRRHRRR
jgi:hypothetical protein